MDDKKPVAPQLQPTQQAAATELSGVAVVIIIGLGVHTIIILFIFAKRQIMRFTLRGRRGPHVSVGQGGLKPLRKEIDRRIEYAAHICHEPKVNTNPALTNSTLRFRVEAVDSVMELDRLLGRYDAEFWRPAGFNLRSFLIECLAGPLCGLEPKEIHRFCDLYEAARHSYKPFLASDLHTFTDALHVLKKQVEYNTTNKPASPKKGTPIHRRTVNRPRRRRISPEDLQGSGECSDTVVVHRNSSTVLLTADSLANTKSTSV